jgi:probable phosphoglycerate mutase
VEVLALRHGQSEYNLLELCNDDPARPVGLTELGREQARRAGSGLSAWSVDRIYSSRLPRAVQTAELINAYFRVPLIETAELNDIRSGFDGRPVSEYLAAIADDPIRASVNGGESLLVFKERIEGFLQRLARQPYQCVVLVTHEETLRVFKAWAQGWSAEQMFGLPFGNCEIYPFELRDRSIP